MEAGLHLLHRPRLAHQPAAQARAVAKAYDGCKSWIEVPVELGARHRRPTSCATEEFTTRRSRILAAVCHGFRFLDHQLICRKSRRS